MNQPNVSQTLLRPQGTHQRREICVLREARGGKGKGCQEASSRIRLSVHGISHCARQDQAIAAARCWLVGLAAAKLKCTFVWASCALARAVPAKRDYSECLLYYSGEARGILYFAPARSQKTFMSAGCWSAWRRKSRLQANLKLSGSRDSTWRVILSSPKASPNFFLPMHQSREQKKYRTARVIKLLSRLVQEGSIEKTGFGALYRVVSNTDAATLRGAFAAHHLTSRLTSLLSLSSFWAALSEKGLCCLCAFAVFALLNSHFA